MKPQQALESFANEYNDRVNELANQVRSELIIPFCDRTGYAFSAGMGSWSFHKGTKMLSNSENDGKGIPKKLLNALNSDTLFVNDLGSLIESYTPNCAR